MANGINKPFLFRLGLILMVSLACGSPVPQQQPTNPPPPVEDTNPTQVLTTPPVEDTHSTQVLTTAPAETTAPAANFDESRVREILFDIQQYPMEDHYRASSDIHVIEALRRWDSGVRVTNADEFEKRIIENTMETVRKNEPNVPINGMELMLSTD